MSYAKELKKIASELKNNEAVLVGSKISGNELLKKIAFVRISMYNKFLPKSR